MDLNVSFIIPVFNRPEEIDELLDSFSNLNGNYHYEVVIVEDGSTQKCKHIIGKYEGKLDISYFFKTNSGPGDSRNFGMKHARGNYFIILDSDCLVPKHYLDEVYKFLKNDYVDCFGGPDAAHESFSILQKAINFSMTSFITTGGIRGNKLQVDKFQPRSFNMGISKQAFEASNGFSRIHPGEDPDLSIRLWNLGFKTKLIPKAFVYHKRRISWSKFYKQVYKFGVARPILNKWHPKTKKITFWFPTMFWIGLLIAIVSLNFGYKLFIYLYLMYLLLCFLFALVSSKNLLVAILAIPAVLIQFFGYGYGFLKSTLTLLFSSKDAEVLFPNMFFKSQQ